MARNPTRKALSAGAALVAAIEADMAEAGVEPDAIERTLLDAAARLADRIAELEAIVAVDGLIVTTPTGQIKTHPAAVESRACSIALPRVLSGITVGDSTAGKNPAKVRAAETRWRGHNAAKAARMGA